MEDCPVVNYFNSVLCLTGYFIITIVTNHKLADKCIYLHHMWQAVKDT